MRRTWAFTLIELLVVVAIIALLLSILLPSLRRAREQARAAVCLANQKTLALAFAQYANDNRDAVVGSFTDARSWVDWPKRANGTYLTTQQLARARTLGPHLRGIRDGRLFPYTTNENVYHCPSDGRETPEVGAIAFRTYSMLNCMNGDPGWEDKIGGTRVSQRWTEIRWPSEKIVFIEEGDPRGVNMNSWVTWLDHPQWIDPLTVWHDDKSTIAFADGHAEIHAWQDQRTIKMSREQTFNQSALDNPDWEYVRRRWTIAE